MPRLNLAFLTLLIAALIMLPLADVHAKRLGGGRSFGSKPSYSLPYQRARIQPQHAATPAKTAPAPQSTRSPLPNRNGLASWLAPLLVGGLLGSLLFGGTFEHLNLADFLVFAGLALLAFKLLARRSRSPEQAPYSAGVTIPHQFDHEAEETSTRPFDTDLLFKQGQNKGAELSPTLVDTPADFDAEQFLEYAKQLFRYLQSAWNQGELAEIRALTTDEVFMEIKAQKEAEAVGSVKVLALEAQLLDYRETSDSQMAAVLFTALMEEDGQSPQQIEEIWHFIRAKSGFKTDWRLDGIQQIE